MNVGFYNTNLPPHLRVLKDEIEGYAREYFRCIVDDGGMVWIYRDARADGWYLHGWWD